MLEIDGVALPIPNSFAPGYSDVDSEDSGRNLEATMIRDVIAKKRKLEIEYSRLTAAEIQTVLRATAPKYFRITYPDPELGHPNTIEAYCANKPVSLLRVRNGKKYWSVNLSITER